MNDLIPIEEIPNMILGYQDDTIKDTLVAIAETIPEEELTPQNQKALQSMLNINLPMASKDVSKLFAYATNIRNESNRIKELADHYLLQRLNPEIYKMALLLAIEAATRALRAEAILASYLRAIPTNKGRRKDLDDKENKKLQKRIKSQQRTKAEIIKEVYGLTPQQAKDISKLEDWAVEDAIELSKLKNKIPTREWAIQLIKEKHKTENNKPYNPEAIYMDHVPYPQDVMKLPPIRSTTLCSNVGIDEYFLEYAHVKNCIMLECDHDRVKWYKEIYPNVTCIEGYLEDENKRNLVINEHIKQGCKLIMATPPCQTVSVAGKRDFNDSRTKLFLYILDIIEAVDSINDYVLIENVPPYMTASPKGLQYILKGMTIVEYIKYRLEQLGYEVNIDKINAANYGTPQSRERVIILASKKGIWKFPIPFKKQVTLMEAIGYLPSINSDLPRTRYYSTPKLTKQEIEMLKHTPTGQSAWDNAKEYQPKTKEGKESGANRKSRFKRNSWDKPAHTLTSDSDNISGMNTIHPGRILIDEKTGEKLYSDPRVFNLKEKLIILGFPNSEAWCNDKAEYKVPEWASSKLINDVLGESFLPRLAAVLAETIPNRTAHPDEKLEDYPQMVHIEGEPLEFYPIVDENLRNYNANEKYEKKKAKEEEQILSMVKSKLGLTTDEKTNTIKKE